MPVNITNVKTGAITKLGSDPKNPKAPTKKSKASILQKVDDLASEQASVQQAGEQEVVEKGVGELASVKITPVSFVSPEPTQVKLNDALLGVELGEMDGSQLIDHLGALNDILEVIKPYQVAFEETKKVFMAKVKEIIADNEVPSTTALHLNGYHYALEVTSARKDSKVLDPAALWTIMNGNFEAYCACLKVSVTDAKKVLTPEQQALAIQPVEGPRLIKNIRPATAQ